VSCCKSEHPNDDDKKPTRSTDLGRGGGGEGNSQHSVNVDFLALLYINHHRLYVCVCVCHDEQGRATKK
jgi:hypothetical protein